MRCENRAELGPLQDAACVSQQLDQAPFPQGPPSARWRIAHIKRWTKQNRRPQRQRTAHIRAPAPPPSATQPRTQPHQAKPPHMRLCSGRRGAAGARTCTCSHACVTSSLVLLPLLPSSMAPPSWHATLAARMTAAPAQPMGPQRSPRNAYAMAAPDTGSRE